MDRVRFVPRSFDNISNVTSRGNVPEDSLSEPLIPASRLKKLQFLGHRKVSLDKSALEKQRSDSSSQILSRQSSWFSEVQEKRRLSIQKRNYNLNKIPIPEGLKGVFSTRYSECDDVFACGFGNGTVQIFNETTFEPTGSSTLCLNQNDPVVGVHFHPNEKNVVAACASGNIFRVHKDTFEFTSIAKENNEIHSTDLGYMGKLFFTGGEDGTIRVYDVEQRKLVKAFREHTSRVFAVKCYTEENLFLSGGWDKMVRLWDLRNGRSTRKLNGPYICGETIDVSGNIVLTGAWTSRGSFQLWDVYQGKLIDTIMIQNKHLNMCGEYSYCCQFYKMDISGDKIVAGMCGVGTEIISLSRKKVLVHIKDQKGVQALDNKNENIIFGGLDDSIRVAVLNDLQ